MNAEESRRRANRQTAVLIALVFLANFGNALLAAWWSR